MNDTTTGDTYPTILIDEYPDGLRFIDYDNDDLPEAGYHSIVPLPDGFVLRREPCPTCHGEDWCVHGIVGEHGRGTPDGPMPCPGVCPTCLDAGGFPVLWAPCDNPECVDGMETTGGYTWEGDPLWGSCSSGCVNGMKPVRPPVKETGGT